MISDRAPRPTKPGFSYSIVKRAVLEGIADRRLEEAETKEAIAFFGSNQPACVFCGELIQRWDHLVPVSKGGDTVLGNMVPACARCDDSKQDQDFEEWARGAAPNSPTTLRIPDVPSRLSRIREYVARYSHCPRLPAERLDPGELKEYQALLDDLQHLQGRIDSFLKTYRQRRNLR